ncbi:unnamed protein product [Schistosoma curassoni]|uniref:SAC domain-containing protein n=1 Tax=Schistosoma curassoni TaxID=6186 RepID=A0A183KY56_9TREM|nr:unnamed protein product [Schistosoma curassoni]
MKLRKDETLTITKPDEGGGIVLMNKNDYMGKMETMLGDSSKFQKITSNCDNNNKGYGYNSGVVLMDLAKLRSAAWNHLWMSAIKFVMKATRYLSAGEQGVINLIMFRNNETFYKIPCEWNIQLSSGVDVHRCPVSWLAENSLLNNRDLMYGKQPKIVYLNHQVKPEYLDLENILNVDTNVSLTNYNGKYH